jgi:gluconolactonase
MLGEDPHPPMSKQTSCRIESRNLVRLALASALLVEPVAGQTKHTAQPEIPGVIRAGTAVHLVKSGFHGLEGPVSAPDGGLYFSAIEESRIYKLHPPGIISVWRENTNGTNGLYRLADGRLLCAEGLGRRIISIGRDGTVTVLANAYKDRKLRQPNDLVPDRQGGVYFTDPAPRPAPDVAPKEKGDLFYIRSNGELVLLDDQIARPNGLTLSLDGKTLFVDDTEGRLVYR